MARKFNTGPYFDDFDPQKNFYKVLYKPGLAVQARELNQMQSIFQNQISAIGNHIFKKNSIVIPGGIYLINTADIVSISDIPDVSTLVGKTITNATSFDPVDDSTLDGYITAVVIGYKQAENGTPAALYVKYFKTQSDGRGTFAQGEELRTVDRSLIRFNVDSTLGSTIGKVATISDGTFYTRELFVDCFRQSVIVEVDNATTTNCIIGLQVNESVVTSDDDESLLDNANGTPNQYAPGADRYKVELTLQRIDSTTDIDDDYFIKMMEVKNNEIVYLNNKTEYAELMKTLARRTYDANGNFIVSGLGTSVAQSPDDNYVWVDVSRGRCYLGGYEYDQIANVNIAIEKPRTEEFQQEMDPVVKYTAGLPYFYIAGGELLKEVPQENSLVQFTNVEPGGSGEAVIGHGIFKHIEYAFGTYGTNDVYKVFFDYVSLEKGYVFEDVGGITGILSGEGAPVLHELRLGSVNGIFTAGNQIESASGLSESGRIYSYVNNIAYVIKDSLNRIPSSDVVKDGTTNAVGSVRLYFVTNYDSTFVPMIEVDKDTIKTLYNNDDENVTSFSIVRRDVFTITDAGTYQIASPLGGDDVFSPISPVNYFGFVVDDGFEQSLDLTNIITVIDSNKRYQLEVPISSPMVDKTVIIYSTVIRNNITEASKTLVTETSGISIPLPSSSWMPLRHQDVVNVTKIVDGKSLAIEEASWNESLELATFTTSEPHNLVVNDLIIVRGVESVNNEDGLFYLGYNGQFRVNSLNDTQFTVVMETDPGTFIESDGVVALPPDINNDLDITSRYTFDSGNTAFLSGAGSIKLKKNATPPQNQIGVRYQHYVVGNGGYVSVDSYGNRNSSDLSYIGKIGNLVDAQKNVIETRRYIDFRTRPSNYFFKNVARLENGSNILKLRNLNLSGRCVCFDEGAEKFAVGPGILNGAKIKVGGIKLNVATGDTEIELLDPDSDLPITADNTYTGIYYIGLNTSALSIADTSAGAKTFTFPKDASRFGYQYVKFKPKQVLVYIEREKDLLKVNYKEISSLTEAVNLRRNEFKMPLTYLYMAPYTVNIRDINTFKFENPVYTMLDIHNIKNRIDRTEYYTSLALNRDLEDAIRDAESEGLTTSQYGYWNENFANVMLQSYDDDDFQCTVYDRAYVAPGTVTRVVNLELDSNLNKSTWVQSGSALTLPYVETRAFGNTVASRSNNLNPFNTINWNGKLTLNPSVDNWIDVTFQISATVNNTTNNITNITNEITEINNTTNITNETIINNTIIEQTILPPPVETIPPPVLPPPPVDHIVTEINNLRVKWGPDSLGGSHSITFDWVTNLGKTGRVNSDYHLSAILKKYGVDGVYAKSLINKKFDDVGVKEYLMAGTHFDQKSPSKW